MDAQQEGQQSLQRTRNVKGLGYHPLLFGHVISKGDRSDQIGGSCWHVEAFFLRVFRPYRWRARQMRTYYSLQHTCV